MFFQLTVQLVCIYIKHTQLREVGQSGVVVREMVWSMQWSLRSFNIQLTAQKQQSYLFASLVWGQEQCLRGNNPEKLLS